jgi:hypothetical protein
MVLDVHMDGYPLAQVESMLNEFTSIKRLHGKLNHRNNKKDIEEKVAIIGEISKLMIASQAIQVIRIKDKEKQEKAVSLYMFLKSDLGQTILSSLVAGVAMPQISTLEIKKLNVPNLKKEDEEKLLLNFNSETEMYNQITILENKVKQLHNEFLGESL